MCEFEKHERTNIRLSAADRSELEAAAADRTGSQKHVWRVMTVLLTADGHGTAEIMRATGKAKMVIWRSMAALPRSGLQRWTKDPNKIIAAVNEGTKC